MKGSRRDMWLLYEMKHLLRKAHSNRKIVYRVFKTKARGTQIPTKYCGKKVRDIADTNKLIYECIINKTPYMAGRIGGNEMNMIAYYFRNILFPFRTDARREVLHDLCHDAGFFPESENQIKPYVELMISAVGQANMIGIWDRYMEEWFIKTYAPLSTLTYISHLQPWNVAIAEEDIIPWTVALKNKKVLVIHPFEETIKKQYPRNRQALFASLDIDDFLPEFQLITLKAVQTIGNTKKDYASWFDALEDMKRKVENIDFDVAIIGCGAYGFPLAAEIKKMGKVAIHLGGVTQLLFGIRGKRWDSDYPLLQQIYNQSWCRASGDEVLPDVKSIENGCYW